MLKENTKLTEKFIFDKITIVGGAGGLGSTMAFYIGLAGISREILLIDPQTNVLNTHEIDLRECFVGESLTHIKKGDWKDAKGTDVVIMSASKSGRQVKSRNDYLKANLGLVRGAAKNIKNHAPDAFLISATAPVDAYVMIFLDELKCERNKVCGFCINDSQRFRYALGEALNIEPSRTFGIILGEHGETQVPLFSNVKVDGITKELSLEEKKAAKSYVDNWYPMWQSQDSGRTTTWSSAVGMLNNLKSLGGLKSHMPFMGSVLLDGEYGLKGVALGMPLAAGAGRRWDSIIELPISPEEEKALKASAKVVKETYAKSKEEKDPKELKGKSAKGMGAAKD
jgi:malate/lactate dehydrogenase